MAFWRPLLLAALLPLAAHATPAPGDGYPQGAQVYFIGLKDGDVVPPTFKVKFGLKVMDVRKAGEDIFDRKTGHHHLLIDTAPIPKGEIVPFSEHHIHYGKAQTETTLTLPPGEHTLTMQFADGAHMSYGPQLAATVKIVVKSPETGLIKHQSE
ncbi:DUF4399 domain-containing protein [Chitinimonas sp.]|uniref:DUF4399 domain-containing protein n=1 Tax=Chitinimonas sp. TaxID=1934313 RepID=UPI002F938360